MSVSPFSFDRLGGGRQRKEHLSLCFAVGTPETARVSRKLYDTGDRSQRLPDSEVSRQQDATATPVIKGSKGI